MQVANEAHAQKDSNVFVVEFIALFLILFYLRINQHIRKLNKTDYYLINSKWFMKIEIDSAIP